MLEQVTWSDVPSWLAWAVATWMLAAYLFRSLPSSYMRERWLWPRPERCPEARRMSEIQELLRANAHLDNKDQQGLRQEWARLRDALQEKTRARWWQVPLRYLLDCIACQHGWAAVIILAVREEWSGFVASVLLLAGLATVLQAVVESLKHPPVEQAQPSPGPTRLDRPVPGLNGPARRVPVEAGSKRGCKDCP